MKLLLLLSLLFSVCECQEQDAKEGLIILIVVFGGGSVVAFLCFVCLCYFRSDGTCKDRPSCGSDEEEEEDDSANQCYLCHKSVPESDWKSGKHRRLCAAKNEELLRDLKTISIKCKQCREPLRLWPKMGAEFYCATGYSCDSHGKGIVNTGINRFNCFQCNIDFCLPCVEEKMGADIVNDGTCKDKPSCGSDEEEEEDAYQCYLCQKIVPESDWKSKKHQRLCAAKNDELLRDLKTISIKCKQCREPLRLWPKMGSTKWRTTSGAEEFYCNTGYSCDSHGKVIINTGINRFTCFQCDIDFCLPCVEEKMGADIV